MFSLETIGGKHKGVMWPRSKEIACFLVKKYSSQIFKSYDLLKFNQVQYINQETSKFGQVCFHVKVTHIMPRL